jgi:hypothetical protein
MPRVVVLALLSLLGACSGGGGGDSRQGARLLVTAGTNVLEPGATTVATIDLTALGADRIETQYRLTTPAGAPLQFELVSWRANAEGIAVIAVDHLRDGSTDIGTDGGSLANAGLMTLGQGLWSDGNWTQASGNGFVRMTFVGRIVADQLLAVRTEGGGVAVVEIAIGDASAINRMPGTEPELNDVIARDTILSSDSWQFGHPAVAVSGDRTSIVCYEGDRQQPNAPERYEQRLQHDRTTGAVTGGAGQLPAIEAGYWRDHEIVALYNVLGVVRSESTGLRVRLSFDRGASFGQDVQVLPGMSQTRLVQAAMAADYSLAIATWRVRDTGGLEFVLIEGRPVAFDAFGSPTWFQFTPAQVLHATAAEVTPLTTGIAFSAGGDLVIGYAYTGFGPVAGGTWAWGSRSEFRCATRRYGEQFVDTLVDAEELFFAMDPTVAVLGQGDSLRIFYAYEVRAGVRLAVSEDRGATFAIGPTFGQAGDYLPMVFAREVAGAVRVDVLYLATRELGTELHRSHWTAWPAGPRVDEALTRARLEVVDPTTPWESLSVRVTQVPFFGYDAVLDGTDIVAVYDETTFESQYLSAMMMVSNASTTTSGSLPPVFSTATPPPLAPGLTVPMPAPNPAHSHQLKLLRLR